jgi:hypothetical protein
MEGQRHIWYRVIRTPEWAQWAKRDRPMGVVRGRVLGERLDNVREQRRPLAEDSVQRGEDDETTSLR